MAVKASTGPKESTYMLQLGGRYMPGNRTRERLAHIAIHSTDDGGVGKHHIGSVI